jgi:phosphatidylserine/phosphatidylglycerophosphate/cardiolipin synthase-like enzyme
MTTLFAPIDVPADLVLEPRLFAVPAGRFAGEPVWWLKVAAVCKPQAMVDSARQVFTGLTGTPVGPMTAAALLELTPMPGGNATVLHNLLGGTPVQYVLMAAFDLASVALPDQQVKVAAGEAVMTTSQDAWIGFVRQDRICRDLRAWVDDLEAAAGSASLDAGWAAYRDRVRSLVPPTIRLTDHTGRPLTSGSFRVSVNAAPALTVNVGADGDTGIVVAAGTATVSAAATDILASATSDSGALGAAVTVTPQDRQLGLLRLDLWLPPRRAGVTGLQRWSSGNHVAPIVDGLAYFAHLVPDLRSAKGGGAVGLAGWAFVMEALADPTKKWSLLPEDDSTQLVALVQDLAGSADVRLLVNQFLQISDDELDALNDDAAVALVALILLLDAASVFGKLALNPAGWVALAAAPAVVDLLPSSVLLAAMRALAEPSKSAVDAINDGHGTIAVWSPYPAMLADNPLAENPLHIAGVEIDALTHIGVYHEKIALIQPAGTDPVHVAYVGGIDLNSDRLDNTDHRAAAPFHDVQVRLLGPAINDLMASYAERAAIAGTTSPLSRPATPLDPPGRHVVQVGRTRFAPTAGGGTPFPSAPHGEDTTHATLLAAIGAAKDFIYIEEQYFTPDNAYVDALVAAGQRNDPGVKALVITLPDQTTQPYGAERRGQIIARLATTWGDRLLVGAPIRRYLNPTPQVFAGLGRLVLRAALDADGDPTGAAQGVIGPVERIPAFPFWAFIESELVFVTGVGLDGAGTGPIGVQDADSPDSPLQTWQWVTIQRAPTGQSSAWGAKPDKHDKGSAVLAVQLPGIYVHAKLMIVDDVFLSVGSSNLNRRGLEHDGETNVFAVPESLKRDPDNPAMRLRCQLWADHLGLPTELSLSLLADPISALPFFQRSWYRGNHWLPLQFGTASEPPVVVLGTPGSLPGLVLGLTKGIVTEAQKPTIWATVADPTTVMDPHTAPADRGPDL